MQSTLTRLLSYCWDAIREEGYALVSCPLNGLTKKRFQPSLPSPYGEGTPSCSWARDGRSSRWRLDMRFTRNSRRSRDPALASRLVRRAQIVLHCAEGVNNTVVAEHLGVTRPTVGTWRERFRR